ncbi:hypothetical protein [Stygiolobus caldivivus]|uniref:Uncharacterized protein n=1 Tax=Stygiolobus caldivivus TaxID=2824673 RepID=A0A8D5U9Z9_9CREN|nr:hypothetical protein [Stygiolobus caldivivus]BCU71436.1 hypothetical protein KN1_27330 [Stygiolobus caldivivus]
MEQHNKIVTSVIILFLVIGTTVTLHNELTIYYFISIFLLGIAVNSLFSEARLNILFVGASIPLIINYSYPDFAILVIGLAAVACYYYREFSQVVLILAINLFVINLSDLLMFFSFVSLLIALRLSKIDSRAFIASGIILLLVAAYLSKLSTTLGDLAYFNLLFGTIGIVTESSKVKLSPKLATPLVLLTVPLVSWALPIPYTYYWWVPYSFFFKYGIINLWLPGLGYFPAIEMFPVYFISHFLVYKWGQFIAVHIFIFVLYYISALSSYLLFSMFDKGRKIRVLSAILYSLLMPITSIPLSITYSILPLSLYLARKISIRNYVLFFITSVLSSSIAYPFDLTFSAIVNENVRKDYAVIAFIASLFWLTPYFILGYPSNVEMFYSIFTEQLIYYILFLIILGIAFVTRSKIVAFSALLGVSYIVLGFPFFYLLYPFVILSTFIALLNSANNNSILAIFLLSLFVLSSYSVLTQPFYHQSPAINSVIKQLERLPFGTVYWNSSYPLMSPLPITNFTTFANYIVENDSIVNNTNYLGYPVFTYYSNTTLYKHKYITVSVKPLINAKVQRYNGSFIWVAQSPHQQSSVSVVFTEPENLSGELKVNVNITDLEYFYVEVYSNSGVKYYHNSSTIPVNGTIDLIDLICYNPQAHEVFNVSLVYQNSTQEENLLIIPPVIKNEIIFIKNESFTNGHLVISITSNVNFTLRFDSGIGLTFSLNGMNVSNLTKTYELPPGHYEIMGVYENQGYIFYGELATVTGFALGLLYALTMSNEKIRSKFKKVFKVEKIEKYIEG